MVLSTSVHDNHRRLHKASESGKYVKPAAERSTAMVELRRLQPRNVKSPPKIAIVRSGLPTLANRTIALAAFSLRPGRVPSRGHTTGHRLSLEHRRVNAIKSKACEAQPQQHPSDAWLGRRWRVGRCTGPARRPDHINQSTSSPRGARCSIRPQSGCTMGFSRLCWSQSIK